MRSVFLPLAFASLALSAALTAAQEPAEVRDLGPLLEEVLAKFDSPGIGAAIVTSEGLVALGVAGLRERGSESQILIDDRFHIGSCTKSMTASLLAISVEADRLAWDTTLADAFPELVESMDEAWRAVTVSQLLCHTSGLTNDLSSYGKVGPAFRSKTNPVREVRYEFTKALLERPPLTVPGKKFSYSNYGYVIVGTILERLEKQPWEELMRQRLFKPLGMKHSGFGGPDAPYFVEPVDEKESDGPPQPRGHFKNRAAAVAFDNAPALGPAGTVHCTLKDWAKYVRLHLRGARDEEDLLLEASSFKVLHSAQRATMHLRNWAATTYGYGWVYTKRQWSEAEVFMHDGSNTAWFACVWVAPEEDFAVLVSCNQGGSVGRKTVDEAARRLIAELTKD